MLFVMHKRLFLSLGLAAILMFAPAAAWAETTITTSNDSDGTETKSGDATATNSGTAQVGHQGGGETDISSSDIDNEDATNVQEGDNDLEATQNADTQTGSAVGGQVIGAVVDGTLTVDATNASNDVEAETGDATSDNDFAAFVGLSASSETSIGASDVFNDSATNVQEGGNSSDVAQSSNASTGDAVGGQIFGATVSGASDIVLANTSDDAETTSGDADENSDSSTATGLFATGVIDVV